MTMLVLKSRRPRRWFGVAVFAAVAMGVLWAEHRDGSAQPPAMAAPAPDSVDSFEPPAAIHTAAGPSFAAEAMSHAEGAPSAEAPQSAQRTGVAPSKSVSTPGAIPSR